MNIDHNKSNKWHAIQDEDATTATMYARKFLQAQEVDASVLSQEAANHLRALEQIRATLATAHAREQRENLAKQLPQIDAKPMPKDVVTLESVESFKSSATCAA